ncbi:SCO4983 family protein [Streptomyces sp. NPDC002644]
MYEPIRGKSVHTMAAEGSDVPRRSREAELEFQLAGHLAALLALTDELRSQAPCADLDEAAEQLAQQVARLRGGGLPARAALPVTAREDDPETRVAALHRRAHDLAGRALVVAASRADTRAAILAAQRMEAHAEAVERPLSPC